MPPRLVGKNREPGSMTSKTRGMHSGVTYVDDDGNIKNSWFGNPYNNKVRFKTSDHRKKINQEIVGSVVGRLQLIRRGMQ